MCLKSSNYFKAIISLQAHFDNWRNQSSLMKSRTEELKEAAETIALDILQLDKSVSKRYIFDWICY